MKSGGTSMATILALLATSAGAGVAWRRGDRCAFGSPCAGVVPVVPAGQLARTGDLLHDDSFPRP